MKEAFVYCWTDHRDQKLYVGSHKGSADDGYICSSKSMLEEYSKRSNDFTRQIIAYGDYEDVIKLETKILKANDAKCNVLFYNMHNGDGLFFNKGHSNSTRLKIAAAHTGKIYSVERKQQMSEKIKKALNRIEVRKKLSISHMGYVMPQSQKNAISIALKGKKKSKEHVEKVAAAQRGKPRVYKSEESKKKSYNSRQGSKWSEEQRINFKSSINKRKQWL